MCSGCYDSEDDEVTLSMIQNPKLWELVDAIKSVHTAPFGGASWHGGPAHVQLDDWNIDMDVPASRYSESFRADEIFEESNKLWFDSADTPWYKFASIWNESVEQYRALALAIYDGYETREFVKRDAVVWPPIKNDCDCKLEYKIIESCDLNAD